MSHHDRPSIERRIEGLEHAIRAIARVVVRDANELASIERLLEGGQRQLSGVAVTVETQ